MQVLVPSTPTSFFFLLFFFKPEAMCLYVQSLVLKWQRSSTVELISQSACLSRSCTLFMENGTNSWRCRSLTMPNQRDLRGSSSSCQSPHLAWSWASIPQVDGKDNYKMYVWLQKHVLKIKKNKKHGFFLKLNFFFHLKSRMYHAIGST